MSAQARPQDYARAIYDLALEAWTRQLGDVEKVLGGNAELRARLDDPGTSVGERLKLLDAATPGRFGEGVHRFLGTLLEAGQLDQLDRILVELDTLVQKRPERRIAHVTSAVALTAAEKAALRARLSDRYGPDLEFKFDVDSSLIGGVRLRVGDQVIDGSIAGKLAALRDKLTV